MPERPRTGVAGKGPTVQARVEMERSRNRGRDGSGHDPNPLGLRKTFLWKQLPQRKQLPPGKPLTAYYQSELSEAVTSFFPTIPPFEQCHQQKAGDTQKREKWEALLNKRFKSSKTYRNITGLSKKPQSVGICRCWVQSYPFSSFWK